MTTSLRIRRGTTAQHSTFTGLGGEITVDTTKNTLVVHDGATVGGIPLAKESAVVAAVRYDTASQGLTAGQKTNARANIGAAPTPASTGMAAALADGSIAGRTISQGSGISIANGDGLAGNPTVTNTGVLSIGGSSGAVTLGAGMAITSNVLSCSLTVPVTTGAELFTASGSWTCPPNVSRVRATVVGAGGGGAGKGSVGDNASSGGYGGVSIGYVDVTPGSTYTVTVGVGGAGVITAAVGNPGGSSSFGSLISATGGAGGLRSTTLAANGTGAGGNIRMGAVNDFTDSSTMLSIVGQFTGKALRPAATSSTAAVTWSASLGVVPGAGGSLETSNSTSDATGGVSGLVYLEF